MSRPAAPVGDCVMFAETQRRALDFLPFVLNTVGHFTHQSRLCLPAGSVYHEFLWVQAGVGTFRLGNDTFVLHAGEGVFMRAGLPHSYEGTDFCTQWFTFRGADGLLTFFGVGDWYRFSVPSFLQGRTEKLYDFCLGESTAPSRSAMGYALLCDLLDATASPGDDKGVRARSFLERHFSESVTLDDVCAATGIGRFSLCRRYAAAFGVSPMEDLCRIRMEKAKCLLRLSTDPIRTVGARCGFQSPSYFSLCFRRATGMTPRQYRCTGKEDTP